MRREERVHNYNAFNVYRRELAPGTVSLTGDRAQGDDSKHWAYFTLNSSVFTFKFNDSKKTDSELSALKI